MREYIIETKTKDYTYLPFDEKLTALEMKSFGWVDKGDKWVYYDSYDVDIDLDRNTATVTQQNSHFRVFHRIKPYSYNLIFNILEKIMNINSWLRKKIMVFLFVLTPIAGIVGVINLLAGGDLEMLFLFFGMLAITYLPTLTICLIGAIARKTLRIEEKLKHRLEKNGYAREQNV